MVAIQVNYFGFGKTGIACCISCNISEVEPLHYGLNATHFFTDEIIR